MRHYKTVKIGDLVANFWIEDRAGYRTIDYRHELIRLKMPRLIYTQFSPRNYLYFRPTIGVGALTDADRVRYLPLPHTAPVGVCFMGGAPEDIADATSMFWGSEFKYECRETRLWRDGTRDGDDAAIETAFSSFNSAVDRCARPSSGVWIVQAQRGLLIRRAAYNDVPLEDFARETSRRFLNDDRTVMGDLT